MPVTDRSRVSTSVSGWVPSYSIPSSLQPYAWYDAADTATITSSSGAVSQWNDKSGNGRNLTQATAANQPTTGSNTINSLNVIRFDGSNDVVLSTVTPLSLTVHVFAVVKPTSFPSSYNNIVSQDSTGWGHAILPRSTRKLAVYIGNGSGYVNYDGSGTTTLTANTSYVLEYSWSGTQLNGFVNAATDQTVTSTTTMFTAASSVYVGAHSITGRNYAGDIAEILIFGSVLSSANQTAVRNYLNAKWAVY